MSRLFDYDFYCLKYGFTGSESEAISQYASLGWLCNQWPRTDFNPMYYRDWHELSDHSINPFVHFIVNGRVEDLPYLDAENQEEIDYALVFQSGLFDKQYYQTSISIDLDPIDHYLSCGWREGLWPRSDFDPNYYLSIADGCSAEENPFLHFLKCQKISLPVVDPYGEQVKVQIDVIRESGLFDDNYYLSYKDVKDSGMDPLVHYVRYGSGENRWPRSDFDPVFYQETEASLSEGDNPLYHYVLTGATRSLPILSERDLKKISDYKLILDSELFDFEFYRKSNGIDDHEVDCIDHYLNWGAAQGLKPRVDFDPVYYARTHLNDGDQTSALQHYIEFGSDQELSTVSSYERRLQTQMAEIKSSGLFDCNHYLTNADIASSGIDPLEHYVRYGARENRWPRPDFDPVFYRDSEDSIGVDENPLHHYIVNKNRRSLPIVRGTEAKQEIAYRLISDSGLFDNDYYRKVLKVEDTDFDCIDHYINWGARQGLKPSVGFDPVYYAKAHLPDGDQTLALQHYIEVGKSQSLSTVDCHERSILEKIADIKNSGLFDHKLYLANPDLVNSGIDPIDHYVRYGGRENRWPRSDFDPIFYRETEETIGAEDNPLHHYIVSGSKRSLPIVRPGSERYSQDYENIVESGLFDEEYYRESVKRYDKEFDCIEHFLKWGAKQGLRPKKDFDPVFYSTKVHESVLPEYAFQHYIERDTPGGIPTLNSGELKILENYKCIKKSGLFDFAFYLSSTDLAALDIDPIDHYVKYGWKENRWPRRDFDPDYYRSITEGISDFENPFVHFLENDGVISHPIIDPSEKQYYYDHELISNSGLFDEKFYRKNINIGDQSFDCIDHFLRWGADQGLQPSPTFDCGYYVERLPIVVAPSKALQHYIESGCDEKYETVDPNILRKLNDTSVIAASGLFDSEYYLEKMDLLGSNFDALEHYVWHGNRDNLWPREDFDPAYYRSLHKLDDIKINTLVYFIESGGVVDDLPILDPTIKSRKYNYQTISESGMFDEEFYRSVVKVEDSSFDCIEHYLIWGVKQGLQPRQDFEPDFYKQTYADFDADHIDPFTHYITVGRDEGRLTTAPLNSIKERTEDPSRPYDNYESPRAPANESLVKTVAFYLPQFHSIPENDKWWGKGFTEWTNVTRARPLYKDHQQPRLPGELGFYDLRLVENMENQVNLAKDFKVDAFCFHYYWFGGKRLLEKPLDIFLENKSLELEFCLCWANENWSRRWDGSENHLLMEQNHSPEDDLAMAADMLRYISDPRYLRVDGKPLVVVYRPLLLPDSKATLERWRDFFISEGVGEICFAAALTFEFSEPAKYGFDVGIEFPPHNRSNLKMVGKDIELSEYFSGNLITYDSYAEEAINNSIACDAPLINCVIPSWDNTARRGPTATIFYGSTPRKFQRVANAVVDRVVRSSSDKSGLGENFLFVNAWNEWAESAVLEPDKNHGHAYLNALSRSVSGNLYNSALVISRNSEKLQQGQISTIGMLELVEIGSSIRLSEYLLENIEIIPQFDLVFYIDDYANGVETNIDSISRRLFDNEIYSSLVVSKDLRNPNSGGEVSQHEKDVLTMCQRVLVESEEHLKLCIEEVRCFAFSPDIFCRHIKSALSNYSVDEISKDQMDGLLGFLTTTETRTLCALSSDTWVSD